MPLPAPRDRICHHRQRSKQARDISRALPVKIIVSGRSTVRGASPESIAPGRRPLAEVFQFVQQRLKYVHHLQNRIRARHVDACVFE